VLCSVAYSNVQFNFFPLVLVQVIYEVSVSFNSFVLDTVENIKMFNLTFIFALDTIVSRHVHAGLSFFRLPWTQWTACKYC
jgi:hypothetical protein